MLPHRNRCASVFEGSALSLKLYPANLMEYYLVARLVNSPANDSPDCIVPI
jgi:hypothetical protein